MRHHTGSGRRQVIPTDWAEHHRPTATAALNATCSIRHTGGTQGTFNAGTGTYTGGSANAAHYTGVCGVADLPAAERALVIASEEVPSVGYRLDLPIDAAPELRVDDIVTITSVDDNGDPSLVGKVLSVESIHRSSLAFNRAAFCTENQS